MSDDKKTTQETKIPDILDEIKAVELLVKRHLLIKALGKLKTLARDILETKEECNAILAAIGIDDKDIKRIIDFVNNLPEVQLNDEDRKKIKDDAKKSMESEKKEVQKKAEDKTFDIEAKLSTLMNGSTYYTQKDLKYPIASGYTFTNTAGINDNVMLCANTGETLEIKL